MSANLYCWGPSLPLNPRDRQFGEQLDQVYASQAPPTPQLTRFVTDLLARYPDLTQTEETVWSDGPLINNVIGSFINMGIIWRELDKAMPVIISIAHSHGLHCYDPQNEKFYPAPSTASTA